MCSPPVPPRLDTRGTDHEDKAISRVQTLTGGATRSQRSGNPPVPILIIMAADAVVGIVLAVVVRTGFPLISVMGLTYTTRLRRLRHPPAST